MALAEHYDLVLTTFVWSLLAPHSLCGRLRSAGSDTEVFALLEKAGNDSPFSIEIEFTAAGPKDLAEINQAVMDSAAYLKAQGFHF